MLLAYVVFYFLVWDFLPEIGALRELREFAPNQRPPPPSKGASVTRNRTWACWENQLSYH